MIDPKSLREKAVHARTLASRGSKSSTYLLHLADDLDAEAARLDAKRADSKRLRADIDPGPLVGLPPTAGGACARDAGLADEHRKTLLHERHP
jgi:hypothetical protein